MGVENIWMCHLLDLYHGVKLKNPVNYELSRYIKTPHQESLFTTMFFDYSHKYGSDEEKKESLDCAISFYKLQLISGHMATRPIWSSHQELRFTPNEMFVPGIHYHLWALSMFCLYVFAKRESGNHPKDEGYSELVDLARLWLFHHMTCNRFIATPEGRTISLGARAKAGKGAMAPLRDCCYQLAAGLPPRGRWETEKWWEKAKTDPTAAAAWILRYDILKKESGLFADQLNRTPLMYDEVVIVRCENGHFCYAPFGLRASDPIQFALVNYRKKTAIFADSKEEAGKDDVDIIMRNELGRALEVISIHAHDDKRYNNAVPSDYTSKNDYSMPRAFMMKL